MHQRLHTPMEQGFDESQAQFMYISITSCHGNCTVHGCLTCTCSHHFCAQVDDDGNRILPRFTTFLHQCPLSYTSARFRRKLKTSAIIHIPQIKRTWQPFFFESVYKNPDFNGNSIIPDDDRKLNYKHFPHIVN